MRSLVVNPVKFNNDFDNVVNSFFGNRVRRQVCDCAFMPRTNVEETKDNLSLIFELPGMDKKDIKVTVHDKVLTVSGERKLEAADKENGFMRSEISNGAFSRSFTLPDTVNTESVTADYRQGMLFVTLAKKEEVKPKDIEIHVS